MSDETINDVNESTDVDLARSSWVDPEFYKHSPCPHCGSDDVAPVVDKDHPESEPTHWTCPACGELIP